MEQQYRLRLLAVAPAARHVEPAHGEALVLDVDLLAHLCNAPRRRSSFLSGFTSYPVPGQLGGARHLADDIDDLRAAVSLQDFALHLKDRAQAHLGLLAA